MFNFVRSQGHVLVEREGFWFNLHALESARDFNEIDAR